MRMSKEQNIRIWVHCPFDCKLDLRVTAEGKIVRRAHIDFLQCNFILIIHKMKTPDTFGGHRETQS